MFLYIFVFICLWLYLQVFVILPWTFIIFIYLFIAKTVHKNTFFKWLTFSQFLCSLLKYYQSFIIHTTRSFFAFSCSNYVLSSQTDSQQIIRIYCVFFNISFYTIHRSSFVMHMYQVLYFLHSFFLCTFSVFISDSRQLFLNFLVLSRCITLFFTIKFFLFPITSSFFFA